jgi:hypothetical protein
MNTFDPRQSADGFGLIAASSDGNRVEQFAVASEFFRAESSQLGG